MPWPDEQAIFAATLPAPHLPVPGFTAGPGQSAAGRRFNVYRNNHISSLTDALADGFPVVQALVGEEFFRAMAADYIRREPPQTPVLLAYGATFPAFIAGFPPAQSLAYLSDMAKLERAMAESLNAADAAPLTINALAGIDPAELADRRLILHPSLRLLASDWPVVSIWQAHQTDDSPPDLKTSAGAERAIILRPELTVELHRADAGAYGFYRDLASGASLGNATESLGDEGPAVLPGLLGAAFTMGLVTGIGEQHSDRTTGDKRQ